MARAHMIPGLSYKEQLQKAMKNSMNSQKEYRQYQLAMEQIKEEEELQKAMNQIKEQEELQKAMNQIKEQEELQKAMNQIKEQEELQKAKKASMNNYVMAGTMAGPNTRPMVQDLRGMTLQDKWFDPRFYDELIERENAKFAVIESNSKKSINNASKSKNNNLVETFKNDYNTQVEQTKIFLYQFKEIQKIISNKDLIMSMINGESNLNTLVINIIRGIFHYEIGREENIEIQANLTYPPDLTRTTSFIMKTSGNQSDCLIHSILIDISEDFRRLSAKHRNVIAFFFRKIVFSLIPNLDDESKNRLLTDPTIIKADLYLERDDLKNIAVFYNLNFMVIPNDLSVRIQIVGEFEKPYFIIHCVGSHFSSVKVNNKYYIPYELGDLILKVEREINCKFRIDDKIQNKEKQDEILYVEARKSNHENKCIEITAFNASTLQYIIIEEKDFDKYIIITSGGYKSKRKISKISKRKISKRKISKRKISKRNKTKFLKKF
jgi:hypothetical protein